MAQHLPAGHHVDPADPRAPTEAQWAAMTPAERERAHAALPSEVELDSLPPPEGDLHFDAWAGARRTLDSFFRRAGRRIYVSGNLPIYYPGERMFAPDVVAVADVEPRPRDSWDVSFERKGIDVAIDIHVAGNRSKDVYANVARYARLGIHEYFVFTRRRPDLRGFRLAPAAGQKGPAYQPIVPQAGRFTSEVLGLDLTIEGRALRFYAGTAMLLDAEERMAKVEALANDAVLRQEALEEQLRAAEVQRDAAAEEAEALKQRVREAEAEIERLRRKR